MEKWGWAGLEARLKGLVVVLLLLRCCMVMRRVFLFVSPSFLISLTLPSTSRIAAAVAKGFSLSPPCEQSWNWLAAFSLSLK